MARLVGRVLVLAIFGLLASVKANVEEDELVATVVLFRHGDRAPLKSFPNDKYADEKYWPKGIGQLVNAGKYRAYQLGEYLRHRYHTFLSEDYKYKEISVISSNIDRAIMTAELVLAGLYPPTKEDIWFKNLLWQPIPVHTMQIDNDNLIQMEASCPKYDTLLEKITKMPEFEEVKQRYSDMFKTIAENTGWTNVDVETVKSLFCTMYVYSKHNPSYIPEWYTKLNQKSLKNIAGLAFAIPTYTKEMQRLRTGPFFNYLINHLDGAVKGENPKFLAISGHDSTIASVLSTLNCYSFEPPEFTATVFWEVYKTNSGNHYVNLLYKKNSESEAELIQLDNCKSNVTLDEFKAVFSPILTSEEQWRHDCFDTTSAAGSRLIDSRFLIISIIVLYINKYL